MSESFGARLRYERERRQIGLQTIAESTKISAALLEGLERGCVSRWPTGIFRKAFIRSYAQAIGLDPETIGREFAEFYPDPTESVPVLPQLPVSAASAGKFEPAAEAARLALSRIEERFQPAADGTRVALSWLANGYQAAAATTRIARSRLADTKTRVTAMRQSVGQLPPVTIKFTIVSSGSTFTKGTFLNDVRQRWLAAACDAGVSCVMALCLFAVLGRFWTPLGVSMLFYYVGGILILGNTPGVCLFAPERTDDARPHPSGS